MHSRGEKNEVDTGGEKWNEVQIMGLESKTVSQVKKNALVEVRTCRPDENVCAGRKWPSQIKILVTGRTDPD